MIVPWAGSDARHLGSVSSVAAGPRILEKGERAGMRPGGRSDDCCVGDRQKARGDAGVTVQGVSWRGTARSGGLSQAVLFASVQPQETQGASKPRPLPKPPPRGLTNSTQPRRSLAGAWCQVAAFILQEPCGSSWSFPGSSHLTHHASYSSRSAGSHRRDRWFVSPWFVVQAPSS